MNHLACFLLLCLLLPAASGYAQTTTDATKPGPERALIYFNVQAQAGTGFGPDLGLAAILGERHEIGLAYNAFFARIPDFPDDYECPSCKEGPRYNWLTGGTATYGYVLYPGGTQRFFRFTLRGGVLLGQQSLATNFVRVVNPGPWDDNYTFDKRPRFTAALVLRPSADLAINRHFGLTLGPYAVFSNGFNAVGGSLGINFGRVARDGAHYHRHELSERRAAQAREKKARREARRDVR